MLQNTLSPREIERWFPPHLGQVIGCPTLKDHFKDQLRMDGCGVNTLVSGQPGSGKTATIKAYVRSLMCPDLNKTTLIPCGQCRACLNFDVRYDDAGIFALDQERVAKGLAPINFFPINCGAVTENRLREILESRSQFSGRFLIYLDEAHRIVRRKMDHMLLKPLEEIDATWIASTARPEELDSMFRRRFAANITTTLPSQSELAKFLEDRCTEWGILFDGQAVLNLLARRATANAARAISILAVAAGKPERRLTRDVVIQHMGSNLLA